MARLPELLRLSPSTSTGSITLSKTGRHGRSTGSWNTMPMSRLGPSTSLPRRVTLPAERGSKPARILSRVVFPHPDCPTMVMNSPAPTSTEIPARACTCARPRVAYVFSRLDTTISGAVTASGTLAGTSPSAQGETATWCTDPHALRLPLTLPSPQRGEGSKEPSNIPLPHWGRGQGEGISRIPLPHWGRGQGEGEPRPAVI